MKGHILKIVATAMLWMLCHVVQAGTVTYVYTDPQGTPLAEADASGNITARFEYTPYGVSVSGVGPAPDGPGYTGHVNDPDTGFVYMQARYYDPTTNRFLSADPVAPSAGNLFNLNRYVYANGNPIANTDPDGRCADGVTCDQMVQNYAKFANEHPAEADKLGSTVGLTGVSVMLAATGLTEAVGIVRAAMAVDKALSEASEASAGKTFTTYTRTKPDGTVYSGKTSGTKGPEQQVAARNSAVDHKARTAEGYGPARVDKNSSNPDAIRGREQQLIEQNGGARSQGGTSGNKINGVSPSNPKAAQYKDACAREFGCG